MANDLLNATIHSLKNGLTGIPVSAAIDNTETWQQQLLQSGEPALQDIGREIGNLQSLLSSGTLDGAAIGRSLSMLGAQTNQAAATAPADLQTSLRGLGDLLLQAGGKLEG
jgi:hypothetical protein